MPFVLGAFAFLALSMMLLIPIGAGPAVGSSSPRAASGIAAVPSASEMASSSKLLAKSGVSYAHEKAYLATGQQVSLLVADGGSVQLAEDGPSGYSTFTYGNQTYMEPAGLGAKFDSSIFDLTYLVRNGFTDHVPLLLQTGTMEDADSLAAQLKSSFGSSLGDVKVMSLGAQGLVRVESRESYGADLFRFVGSSQLVREVRLDGVVKALSSPIDNGGIDLVDAVDAWNRFGVDGSGVKIAVLDTGIAPSGDFQFANGTSKIVVSVDLTDDNNLTDLYGHGTHVAGIAAGTGQLSGGAFMGVAPGAQLLNIKVLDGQGEGYDSWIVGGISLAVTDGADIISMSLGGTPDSVVDQMVDWAESQGVLVVVAAGNSGPSYWTVGSPAEASGALTVGADAERGWEGAPPGEYPVYFTSLGPETTSFDIKPDIIAPGYKIISDRAPGTVLDAQNPAYPGYGSSYMELSGTSMATPFVSGAAAVLMQAHPGWNVSLITDALESSATLLTQRIPYGADFGYSFATVPFVTPFVQGEGRLNLTAALAASAVFLTPIVNVGNIYEGASSSTLSIYNPTNAGLTLDLSYNATNVNDGTDATSFVSLSRSQVTVPAGQVVSFTLAVSPSAPSSLFGGYVYATDASTGSLVAHAAFGFYSMHRLTATFEGASGSPMAGIPVVFTPYNSTWLEYGYPYLYYTDYQGKVSIPSFPGLGVFQAVASPGSTGVDFAAQGGSLFQQGGSSSTLLLSGSANVSDSDVSMIVGGSSLLPVTFDPGLGNVTVMQRNFFFMTFSLWNWVGGPDYRNSPSSTGARAVEFYEQGSYPSDTTILISPNSFNDFLGVEYLYGYSSQVAPYLSVIRPTDLFNLGYVFYNVTQPVSIVPAPADMSQVKTSFFGENGAISQLPIDWGWDFALPSYQGMSIWGADGGALVSGSPGYYTISVPSQVTQHVTPGQGYYGILNDEELYGYTGPPAGTVLYDYENAHPYAPDFSIWNCADFEQTNGVSYCPASLMVYPRNSVSGYNTYMDSDQASAIYVGGTYRGSHSWTFSGSFTTTQFELIANTVLNGPLSTFSTTMKQDVVFYADSSFANQPSWYPGAVLRNIVPSGRTLEGTVPAGSVSITFQASVDEVYAASISSVDVQYSVDNGATWREAASVTGSMISHQGILDAGSGELPRDAAWAVGLYNATLGDIPAGSYVSLKFVIADSSGGTTTDVVTRAFLSRNLPSQTSRKVTFTETGLPAGSQWVAALYGPSSAVEAWTSSATVSLSVPDGDYEYLVEIGGPDTRLKGGGATGTVSVAGGDASVNLSLSADVLYRLSFTYRVVGGGTGLGEPTLNFTGESGSESVTLWPSSGSFWAPPGTSWSVSDSLSPSGDVERWQLGQDSTGTVAGPIADLLQYYHQYQVGWSFSVTGGNAPQPPSVLVNRFGTSVSATANSSPAWYDAGSIYSYTNPLNGSDSSRRWFSLTASSRVSGAGLVMVQYYYELALSLGYNVVGQSSSFDAPTLTATQSGMSFFAPLTGTPTPYFCDAGTLWQVNGVLVGSNSTARWTTPQTTSGTVTSPLSSTFQYFLQYSLSFAYTSSGGDPPDPPVIDYVATGTAAHLSLSADPQGIWADSGGNWSAQAVVGGASGERWASSGQTAGPVTQGLQVSIAYFHQFQMSFAYSVLAGTAGSAAPSVNCTAFGAASSAQPGSAWVDARTLCSYPSLLPGSGDSERWTAMDPVIGNASAGGSVSVRYDHQFLVSVGTATPQGGSVPVKGGWMEAGTSLSLASSPSVGWNFGEWQGQGASSYSGNVPTPSVTVESAISDMVVFYPGLTVSVSGPGSVTVSYGGQLTVVKGGESVPIFAPLGTTLTLAAQPDSFMTVFQGWSPAISTKASASEVLGSPSQVSAAFSINYAVVVAILAGVLVMAALASVAMRRRPRSSASTGPGEGGPPLPQAQ
ncbi:MAG TPA: S8 family serine peptidase [Conexivisphaerales archaeon]|nr:S8 family serine peptidase [Conexivisphaerales archaeon]